jgi:predicted MFS family arabinose efflux permease
MESKWPTVMRHRPAPSLRRNLMAGVLALVVALGIGRFAYTPILPVMQERFDFPNISAAALASSNNLGYLLGAVLAAFTRSGRHQDVALRASLWTVMASTVLMGLSADFSGWLVLRFVAGLAGAGSWSSVQRSFSKSSGDGAGSGSRASSTLARASG